jgi:hypothetical protein
VVRTGRTRPLTSGVSPTYVLHKPELDEGVAKIKERFGIGNFRGGGYHVETLGQKTPYAILAYLGKQDEKHNLKSLDEYFALIETIPDNKDSDDEHDE